MQQFPLLTFQQLRDGLERCGCRCIRLVAGGDVIIEDGAPNPSVYAFESSGDVESPLVAVIHVWDNEHPIPHDVIRSACQNLNIEPDVFGLPH